MSSKHTPGPWARNIPPARHYPTIFADRNTHIAYLAAPVKAPDEQLEANCNLIAAAPDLLEAAKAAEESLAQFRSEKSVDLSRLRAAIAKAEGQS